MGHIKGKHRKPRLIRVVPLDTSYLFRHFWNEGPYVLNAGILAVIAGNLLQSMYVNNIDKDKVALGKLLGVAGHHKISFEIIAELREGIKIDQAGALELRFSGNQIANACTRNRSKHVLNLRPVAQEHGDSLAVFGCAAGEGQYGKAGKFAASAAGTGAASTGAARAEQDAKPCYQSAYLSHKPLLNS